MDSAAFKEWLGELFEDGPFKVALSKNAIAALSAGFDKGLLDANYILAEDVELDETQLKALTEVWYGFLDDCIAEEKLKKRSTDRTILKVWLKARYFVPEVVDVEDLDETSSKKVTAQCTEDMRAQGAETRLQLGFLELALALGRPVAPEEYADYEYKAPWTAMKAGRQSVKGKEDNLDEILKEAVVSNSILELEEWLQSLVSQLNDEQDDFARRCSNRISSAWTESKQWLQTPDMIISYWVSMRKYKRGRGLPELVDLKLANSALAKGVAKMKAAPSAANLASLSSSARGSTASSVVSTSTLGPSASMVSAASAQSARESEARTESQLADILSAISASSTAVAGLKTMVVDVKANIGNVNSRLSAIEAKERTKGGASVPCHECGQTDHRVGDCPVRKAKKEAAAAAREAAASES